MTPALNRLLRFGLVGVAGFAVDAGVLTAMLHELGPLGGRLLSFSTAVALTFLLNSRFTFAAQRGLLAPHVEFGRYFASMVVGGTINWSVYGLMMVLVPHAGYWPVVAVGAGSLAGMAANLTLAQRFVFRARVE